MKTKLINGVQKTRDQAVLDNVRLVSKVADRYARLGYRAGIEFDDLRSIGYIGLLLAFDQFDDSKGYQFSTYAYSKIRGEITRAITNSHDRGIRYPSHVKSVASQIKKREMECEPIEVIMKTFQLSELMAKSAIEYLSMSEAIRFDEPVKEHKEDSASYHEMLGFDQDFTSAFVIDFLSRLRPREQDFVAALIKGYTQAEMADHWGVTRTVPYSLIRRIRPKLQTYLLEV